MSALGTGEPVPLFYRRLPHHAGLPIPTPDDIGGVELRAAVGNPFIHLDPGSTAPIPTGLIVVVPEGYLGIVSCTSGVSCVIPPGRAEEVEVPLHNDRCDRLAVRHGRVLGTLYLVTIEAASLTEIA